MMNKLERKLGRFAIPNLMMYIVGLYVAGFIIYLINPLFYYQWLMLDIDMILKGQVWRLVTFLIQPMEENVLLMILLVYVYYSIGSTLERIWGTFRFNMYFFTGVLFNILATVVIYIIAKLWFGVGYSFPISLSYLNMTLFLAFAVMFPDMQFRLMFLIPIKARYLTIAYIVLYAYEIIRAFVMDSFLGICTLIIVVFTSANFLIYYLSSRKQFSPHSIKRRTEFKMSYNSGMRAGMQEARDSAGRKIITRHKCAICGRTELDSDMLEFRFCSKCNGNYEYCQDHLFTHEHVK